MKCNARLIYYKKLTKTGKRKLYLSLPHNWDKDEWFKSTSKSIKDKLDMKNIQVCGGKIIAQVTCEIDDYTPFMNVNFICEDCKQYYHYRLPRNETELNEWLTDIIEQIP